MHGVIQKEEMMDQERARDGFTYKEKCKPLSNEKKERTIHKETANSGP